MSRMKHHSCDAYAEVESCSGVPEFASAAADGPLTPQRYRRPVRKRLHSSRTVLKLTDCGASCHDDSAFFTRVVAHHVEAPFPSSTGRQQEG